jgi:excisionase family DNA binding protein
MATKNTTAQRYAAVAEVAAYTGLSEGTIRTLLATGALTTFRPVPGRILLDLHEVDRLIRKSAGRQSTQGRKACGLGTRNQAEQAT